MHHGLQMRFPHSLAPDSAMDMSSAASSSPSMLLISALIVALVVTAEKGQRK